MSAQPLDPKYNPFFARPKKTTKIKSMIAIVSGKGGVGKSTVTSLLATHTQRAGLQTAILDADITGPSMGRMFGLRENPHGSEEGIYPAVTSTGIELISSTMMLESEDTPILWRGPMIGNAVKEFYTEVFWGKIDVMFVDMPPGTGDVPLTVFQSLPLKGIILVTTPQDLVSMIVSKAVSMANQMNIPILGIIENMSYMECGHCGEKMYPFGQSKLETFAETYRIPILAKLPIHPEYNELADNGKVEEIVNDEFAAIVSTLFHV
jgi:Mrp family chromosome partitioning ATPase